MELWLIRHGDCEKSVPAYYDAAKRTMDPPLTEAGIAQARKLARRMGQLSFDALYSSDLRRAVHTAQLLNEIVQTQLHTTQAFREIDMGLIYQKSWSAFPAEFALWSLHQEDISYPGGENGADVWRRCREALEDILPRGYGRVGIVCHGGTIRAMVCGMLGLPQEKRFYFGLPPVNCAVSVVFHREDTYFLHSFNDDSHLSE